MEAQVLADRERAALEHGRAADLVGREQLTRARLPDAGLADDADDAAPSAPERRDALAERP